MSMNLASISSLYKYSHISLESKCCCLNRKKKLDTYIQDTINCYFQPEIIDYLCETCGVPTARSVQTFTRLPR